MYLEDHGVPLRAIWMADCSNQGASGEANEYVQGDDSKSSPLLFKNVRSLLA